MSVVASLTPSRYKASEAAAVSDHVGCAVPGNCTLRAPELAVAFHEIEQCAVQLGIAVGPELLKAEELMARRDTAPGSEA